MIEKDGSAKGIVFSQYTAFLDLIHYSLQKSGISCVQLVWSMTRPARDAAIKRFTELQDLPYELEGWRCCSQSDRRVTCFSDGSLVEPCCRKPSSRSNTPYRQYKPIRIVRFIIESTVEEKILQLQEKKKLVFEGTVGDSSEALTKLTEADLRFLFS